MLPSGASPSTETNHAATGSRCADEGLSGPLDVGQVWAYFTDNPLYGEDAEGEFLMGTQSRLLEFYSLVSRVSYKIARKPLGLGPKAAKNYEYWRVVVTHAQTGFITTRVQSFPRDLMGAGYRRVV